MISFLSNNCKLGKSFLWVLAFVAFTVNSALAVVGLDEDFDGWTTFPQNAWSYYNFATADEATLFASEANSSPNCIQFSSYEVASGHSDDWLVTSPISLPADAENINLSYWYKHTDFFIEEVALKISTEGNDPQTNTFNTLLETSDYVVNYTEQTYDLSPYAGQTIWLAWHYTSEYFYYWYLDDVLVTYTLPAYPGDPSSPTPADNAQDISVDSDLGWVNGSDTDNVDIYLSTDQNLVANKDISALVASNYISINYDPGTLLNGTEYFWRIVAKNTNRAENNGAIWSFKTEYSAITTYPYTQDFESGSLPANWINWADDSGEDWLFDIPGNNSDPAEYGANSDHTSGSGYIAWIDDEIPNQTSTYLLAPPFDISGLTYPTLTFWYWIGDASLDSHLYVDVFDGGNWVEGVATITANGEWSHVNVDLRPYQSANTKIRFRGEETNSYESDICLDDITVFDNLLVPDCTTLASPAHMQTELTEEGMLVWNPILGANGYKIYFGSDGGGSSDPMDIENATDLGNVTSYHYSGITYNTNYYWKIVPYNEVGDAENCEIWQFTTLSPVSSFPWDEDFENGGVIPVGWMNEISDSGEDWLFEVEAEFGASQDHTSGMGYFAYLDDTTPHITSSSLISVPLDLTGLTNPAITFWYWMGDGIEDGQLSIDVYDGVWNNDVVSFTPNDQWEIITLDLTPYVSNATKVKFRGMETEFFQSDICIDDVSVFENTSVPQCASSFSPTDTETNVYITGTLSWGSVSGASGYKLWFGSDGGGAVEPTDIVSGTDLGNATVYNYTDLDYNTIYYWKVVPYNDTGDALDCSILEFTAEANPTITVFPWIEDFENGGAMAEDWINDGDDSGEEWIIGTATSSGADSDHTSGSGYFTYLDDSSPHVTPTNLITPPLDISALTDPVVAFWCWIGDYDPASILYIDVYDGTTWIENIFSVSNNGQWDEFSLELTAYKSTETKLRFRGVESIHFQSDICLDDVRVFDNVNFPDCATLIAPSDGEAEVSIDGSLTWNPAVGATGYKLYFGINNSPTDIVNGADLGNATSYDYNGLVYNTMHYWKVVPYNDQGDAIDCAVWNFTTIPSPIPAGTYTVGVGQTYTTILEAVADLEYRGISGAVIFELTDATYNEVTPITINPIGGASDVNTVTFAPASGIVPTINIVGTMTESYAIKLNGADYVTIDGLSVNAAGADGKIAICIMADALDPANNNIIKNCNLTTGADGSSVGFYGIYLEGNTGNIIENNDIQTFGISGVYAQNEDNLVIKGNEIHNMENADISTRGIRLRSGVTGADVSDNKIYDITATGTTTIACGIEEDGGSGNTFWNNMIYDIHSGYRLYGIYENSGGAGDSFYFNSVYLSGIHEAAARTAAYYQGSTDAAVTLKNNIFVNTRQSTSSSENYAIYRNSGVITASDYNDFFVTGDNAYVGFYDTNLISLTDWQTASGQDGNSISDDPNFVSITDLKLAYPSPAINVGVDIAEITTDFEGDLRSSPPDMGSDEYSELTSVDDYDVFTDQGVAVIVDLTALVGNPDGNLAFTWAQIAPIDPLIAVGIDNGLQEATLTPDPAAFGLFQIVLEVTDNHMRTDTTNIWLRVLPSENLSPEWSLMETISFDEDNVYTLDLKEYVFDLETMDENLIWHPAIVEDIARGSSKILFTPSKSKSGISSKVIRTGELTVSVDGDGIATFTPMENWFGAKNVIFTVEDADGAQASDTTQVIVNPVNDAPQFVSGMDDWTVNITGDTYTRTVTVFDPDNDADISGYSWENSSEINGFTYTEDGNQVTITIQPQAVDLDLSTEFHTLKIVADDSEYQIEEFLTIYVKSTRPVLKNWFDTKDWDVAVIADSGAVIQNSFDRIEENGGVIKNVYFWASNFAAFNGDEILSSQLIFDPTGPVAIEPNGQLGVSFTSPAKNVSGITSYHGTFYMQGDCLGSAGQDSVYADSLTVMITIYPASMGIEHEYDIVDFSRDGLITSIDVIYFAHHYNSSPGDENWHPIFDIANILNGTLEFGPDGHVGFPDLQYLARYYGQPNNRAANTHSFDGSGWESSMSVQLGEPVYNYAGKTVTVPVAGDCINILGSEIVINFDSNKMELLDALEGDLLTSKGVQTLFKYDVDNQQGTVTLALTGLGKNSYVSNFGIVAELEFELKEDAEISIDSGIAADKMMQLIEAKMTDNQTVALSKKHVINDIPTAYGISQNYPNPFNPTTTITYQVPAETDVTVNIYDNYGRLIKVLVSGRHEAGYYSQTWNGTDENGAEVSSGLYLYKVVAGNYTKTMRMMLLK